MEGLAVEDFLPSLDFVRERRSIFFPEPLLLLLFEPFLVFLSSEEVERARDLLEEGRLRIFTAGRGEEDELFFEFVGFPGEDGAGGGFF